jgi:pilus assembly protein CpaB
MKARGLVLLSISAVLGFISIAWVQKPAQTSGMTKVVVAKIPLNYGDRLIAEKLKLVDYPKEAVPPGAFDNIDMIAGQNQDRVTLRAIDLNEPVLPDKISGTGGRAILSTVIDKNMRAVTISVNDIKGVAGFVQPGDRVDVLLTRKTGNSPADTSEQRNDVLLQNIKVLGVDQQSDDKKDKPTVAKAVTVEVSPEDGQKLTLAASIGNLSLALRNFANPDAAATRSLSVGDLVPSEPKTMKAPVVRPRPQPKIEILRGTDSTTYEVGKDGRIIPEGDGSRATQLRPPAAGL